MKDKILMREERVAIIEAGKVELWRIYYENKVKLEVRRIGGEKQTQTRMNNGEGVPGCQRTATIRNE